ncbi:MAG: hypothetical protein OJF47_003404 [Nitrospira sp.]|nr:MAG: hypothetical protein OJF47_003404 [Nitrospira sp.]
MCPTIKVKCRLLRGAVASPVVVTVQATFVAFRYRLFARL